MLLLYKSSIHLRVYRSIVAHDRRRCEKRLQHAEEEPRDNRDDRSARDDLRYCVVRVRVHRRSEIIFLAVARAQAFRILCCIRAAVALPRQTMPSASTSACERSSDLWMGWGAKAPNEEMASMIFCLLGDACGEKSCVLVCWERPGVSSVVLRA